MFGCAAHLERPVSVLECGAGGVLDPIKVYGERDGEGALRHYSTDSSYRKRSFLLSSLAS